jgi:phosphatidylglycerophosphate synthase
VKPQSALAVKGAEVEEWIDLHFFRPVGMRLARRLERTNVSADQVTVASLVVGVIAGHLFLYADRGLNTAGLVLFIVSDILDSSDGQLARMRGNSTRMGRMLDGISDNVRFLNLYAHLAARLLLAHWGWAGLALTAAAGLSHSFQSAATDFIRQGFLRFAGGGKSELDLPESLGPVQGAWYERAAARIYRDYVRRQAWLLPRTAGLVRAAPEGAQLPMGFAARYREQQGPLVQQTGWIAQNVRFALLVTACVGWPQGFLWLTLLPLNAVLVVILLMHERNATRFLATLGTRPSPARAEIA